MKPSTTEATSRWPDEASSLSMSIISSGTRTNSLSLVWTSLVRLEHVTGRQHRVACEDGKRGSSMASCISRSYVVDEVGRLGRSIAQRRPALRLYSHTATGKRLRTQKDTDACNLGIRVRQIEASSHNADEKEDGVRAAGAEQHIRCR